MLAFIGMGLWDEKDISLKGIEMAKKCDRVYAEFYTSRSSVNIKKLEKLIVKQLEPMFTESKQFKEPKSIFWVINGRSNVVKKLDELFKKARKTINIYTSTNGLSRLLLHKDILQEAHNKGVSINIAAVTNKEVLEEIKSLRFCCVKHIPEAQNHLFAIDGKECLIVEPIPDDDNIMYGRDLGMWVSSHSFAKFLDRFFALDFKRARKINHGFFSAKG